MKKDKILNGIFIVLNCIITYFIASNRWVDRMPMTNRRYSFEEDLYDLFLGRGVPTVMLALITVIILFAINKLIIRKEIKLKKYIYLYLILFIINVIIYRITIDIAL